MRTNSHQLYLKSFVFYFPDSNPLARNLKEVEIPIVPTDVCQRGYLDTLPSTILCAGSGGKGTCDVSVPDSNSILAWIGC